MTREDIIRMAREAGFIINAENEMTHSLERFAALVAAAEREACARVAERSESSQHCAAAIRARGQTVKTCPPCHGDCNQGRACPARGSHA